MIALLFSVALAVAPQDAPIVTAAPPSGETAESVRYREAVAYYNPLPRGAPTADYPLVAWCEALVNGHVNLGESLNTTDSLDLEIMRLGRLEATDFRTALAAGRARQSAETLRQADQAVAAANALWTPLANEPLAARSRAFGLFFGLPGRCEHAARRVRADITTPPATLEDVGLSEDAPAPPGNPAD